MESININDIIKKATAKDADSFRVLYEHISQRIFAYVVTRVNDRMTATEITQDVFVELYKSLATFTYQSDAAFYAFTFTIVRRQLAQRYTEQKKHVVSDIDESTIPGQLLSVEVEHSIHGALDTLDECSKEIIILHHWSRFTFAEIGALIDMTESAVRVRHHRAKALLATQLTS
jgi:RNA polymerase sigma-70 factor, ECF subfamily